MEGERLHVRTPVAWSRSEATRALPSADPVGMERETRRDWTKKE